MADYKILCPACAAILSSKKPIANGKKITCPHCHKPFVAATSEARSQSDSGSQDFEFSPGPPPPGPAAPKHEAPRPREKSVPMITSHQPVAKGGSKRVAIWMLIIGLVVLAGGGGAAGMYYYLQLPETSLAQKLNPNKNGDAKVESTDKQEQKLAQVPSKPKNDAKNDPKKESKNGKGQEKGGLAKPEVVAKAPADKQGAELGKGDAPMQTVAAAPMPPKSKAAEWKEFKSAKGGYAVEFPAKPEELQERDEDIIFYETRSEWNGFTYEITFHRLKKDDLATPAKDRLKKIGEEFKNTLITNADVEFEGVPKVPVMQLTLFRNDKKDVAIERWFVHKEHVFQVSVTGDKAKLGPDQVSRFMQSFRFVADPQGEFLDLTKTTGVPPERKKK